ncbi:Uma2 family endonuclease [Leptolyngbya sp. NK1-12]|uniref:Uma2 family endonuclease n=1 Tax=Leptolyngbya sp. NK1-12 TaxID=2547451 RepID=A0AA97AP16_9CYAN|nr:Uma2 family endonuclease [Leptolyngbya sp. NK1-12]WNZ27392.1 Uma2 family endonuclease [Leptolyngbya sp. NK1-12]
MVAIQLRQFEILPGQSLLLHGIGWSEFEAILAELGEHRSIRIAYDNGWLELMTPLPEHEYFKETISDAVKDIAEELNLDYESYGSTTWRQRAKQAGLEADNCFYFQNEARIRGKLEIDLDHDPPPDLALEIDITRKSLERFPIYARLGVPELWCYDSGTLRIYLLQQAQYVEVAQSQVFPSLAIQELPRLIETYRHQGRLALRRAVRAWVKTQK